MTSSESTPFHPTPLGRLKATLRACDPAALLRIPSALQLFT
ncbi:MAG: hypothetical protein ABIV27_10100 [Gemmatimonadales bacterium]